MFVLEILQSNEYQFKSVCQCCLGIPSDPQLAQGGNVWVGWSAQTFQKCVITFVTDPYTKQRVRYFEINNNQQWEVSHSFCSVQLFLQ